MKPLLKWAGGKRQLLKVISKYINKDTIGSGYYFEPFFGGGSVFFDLQYPLSIINDVNSEIINVYKVVRDYPEELIIYLKKHAKNNNKDYYYTIREKDRSKCFSNEHIYSNIYKAARTIYLNRTCYNGLYRVNSKGYFNTPYGNYSSPLICDEKNIREVSCFLKENNITILNTDFEDAVVNAKKGDLLYFDPPYDYENNGFVNYNKEGFSRTDLIKLKKICDDLVLRGCKVLISNNDTSFVRELFSDEHFEVLYQTEHLKAKRNINCKSNKRNNGSEVLIYGRKK